MGAALLEAAAIAAAGIFSPGSMLIALLLLSAAGGLRKALAYYAGYFSMYVVIGTGTVLIVGRVNMDGSSVTPSWLYVGIGCLLLFLFVRKWRTPVETVPKLPGLFAKIDEMTGFKLCGLGALVACINFKNLSIFLSAIAAVVEARLPAREAVASTVVVAFVFCLAVLGPILLFVAGGKHAKPFLDRLKARLERHSRIVTLVLLMVFGSLMLSRGIYGLMV